MGHFFGEAGIAAGKAGGAWGAPLSFTPSFSGCSLPWLFEVEGSQIQHTASHEGDSTESMRGG